MIVIEGSGGKKKAGSKRLLRQRCFSGDEVGFILVGTDISRKDLLGILQGRKTPGASQPMWEAKLGREKKR